MLTALDEKYMSIALNEAQEGYNRGDFPVGAVLVFDGNQIGKGSNSTRTNREWSSHAESVLIRHYATAIQERKKGEGRIELYTTLEPCLMCLGTSVLNRIDRIVYACPDPNGGAATLDVKALPEWYAKKWPIIDDGILREESYQLLVNHMRQHETWKRVLASFEKMHESW